MGCINDKDLKNNKLKRQQYQTKFKYSNNPIIKIAKQWNIQIIKQKWHDNQLNVINSKFKQISNLDRQQFIKLLPSLAQFSKLSQDNFYNLFNFQQNQLLTVDNFVISQIIITKSDDFDLIADMFFYAYASQANKTLMNQIDFNLFQKQFKDNQLQFMHQTVRPPKNNQGQTYINNKLFRQIFEQYDIKTIKLLFRFDVKQQQRKLQKFISKYGIDRINQKQVFMLNFQWFIKWKNYMEYKYGIRIQLKQNGKNLDRSKSLQLLSSTQSNQKLLKAGEKLASQSDQNFMEPINNDRIQGQQNNQLKEGLIQFSDFISIPAQIWQKMRIVYGGGPQITKPFPHFYNKKIMLAILDQKKCEFQPNFAKALLYDPNQTFYQIYKKRQQRYFKNNPVQNPIAYYKHPGQLQWKKIENIQNKLEEFPFQYKSYLVFVKNSSSSKFQDKFNITTNSKGQKQIKQRIKNYGNILNFQHQGILQQGHVGLISKNNITLYLKSSKGQYLKIQVKINDLQKLNPFVLQENLLQGFAGLQNIGNTCYLNAPLQCLLKTPYFDQYLDSVNLDKSRNNMLLYQLHKIHEQSKNSKNCISMQQFKKRFDEQYSFFQGNNQHDAQQFLLLLLDKLTQQQPRQSLINGDKMLNKKIHAFFSGKTKSTTQCINCHNKGVTQQSFFTYSLSLPIIKQNLFKFYYVNENYKIKQYGLIIDKDCKLGQVIKMIYKQLKQKEEDLLIMTVCEGQWMSNIHKLNSNYQISKLQSFDSSIVCYPILNQQSPDYQDLVQNRTNNSVKVQIRNRVYDQKSNKFKPFHYPFLIQINYETTGKSLIYSIIDKIKKFANEEQYHKFKLLEQQFQNQQINLLETQKNNQSNLLQSNFSNISQNPINKTLKKTKNQLLKSKDLPFTIHYVRNQEGLKAICWFCKKKIQHKSKGFDPQTDCQGCQFSNNQYLYKNKAFMKGYRNLLITIDWKSQLFSKDWTIQQTSSLINARKIQQSNKSNLQILLKQAYDYQQTIQLKCEKPQCRHNMAIHKQIIIQSPNILILHLKRFYYKNNSFHKLKNKVIIPEEFVLPGFNDKYQLYGNVVHYGSGNGKGGHYINYVKVNNRWYKCDDQKVTFTKQSNQHLNSNSYLLFYKKQKIDRLWGFFKF